MTKVKQADKKKRVARKRETRATSGTAIDFEWASDRTHRRTTRCGRRPSHVGCPRTGGRRLLDQEGEGDSEDQVHIPSCWHERSPFLSNGTLPQGWHSAKAASGRE